VGRASVARGSIPDPSSAMDLGGGGVKIGGWVVNFKDNPWRPVAPGELVGRRMEILIQYRAWPGTGGVP